MFIFLFVLWIIPVQKGHTALNVTSDNSIKELIRNAPADRLRAAAAAAEQQRLAAAAEEQRLAAAAEQQRLAAAAEQQRLATAAAVAAAKVSLKPPIF